MPQKTNEPKIITEGVRRFNGPPPEVTPPPPPAPPLPPALEIQRALANRQTDEDENERE